MMEKTGAATKGDGKDIDHIKPHALQVAQSTTGNTRLRSKSCQPEQTTENKSLEKQLEIVEDKALILRTRNPHKYSIIP
jgi:hypothetical protein